MPEIYKIMSRFLIMWIRNSSLKHLPHKDEKSINGRVAKVEGTPYRKLGLPVEQTINEAYGQTADTAVVVKFGSLRIQKAEETIFAIANGWYALRGQSHPCIICFLYISAPQYIQDEQNFEMPSQITLWILINFGNDNKTDSTEIVT